MKIFNIKYQEFIAIGLLFCGVALLFCSFWVIPTGVIDSSVLVAFGEILVFVGSLMGIDYTYKVKTNQ